MPFLDLFKLVLDRYAHVICVSVDPSIEPTTKEDTAMKTAIEEMTKSKPATSTMSSLLMLMSMSLWLRSCGGAPSEDKVLSLPPFGRPPTVQYSGFVDATEGCNTAVNGEYCRLHYWFAAAKVENEYFDLGDDVIKNDQPVVLWLNGGPGTSAAMGFLQELGPLILNAEGDLLVNPYSWTNVANVFILEAPLGVGYSYCAKQAQGEVCENTDKFTASSSRAALVDFFTNKFPELKDNKFFIVGESYAGVYIPTLAYEILKYNEVSAENKINLKGVAMGNPCIDNRYQGVEKGAEWYGYKNGYVTDDVHETLEKCGITVPYGVWRNPKVFQAAEEQPPREAETEAESQRKLARDENLETGTTDTTDECLLAYRKFMLSSSGGIRQGWDSKYIDLYSLYDPISSNYDDNLQRFMNRPEIKLALHVEETPIDYWPYPKGGFFYVEEYNACNRYVSSGSDAEADEESMISFYRKIAPLLNRTWVYNGDTDPCITYEGTRTAVERVGFAIIEGGGYRPWFYNNSGTSLEVLKSKDLLYGVDLSAQPAGIQFGGEMMDFGHGLSFLTIHGSGHMAPQFRPQATLHMLSKFIGFERMTPLLPPDEAVQDMCDDCFEDLLDDWTKQARSLPYIGSTVGHYDLEEIYDRSVSEVSKSKLFNPWVMTSMILVPVGLLGMIVKTGS